MPLSRIYSIATFYTTFSLTPRGKHLITLCMGTVCYLKGAKAVAEAMQRPAEDRAGRHDGGPPVHVPAGELPRRLRAGAGDDD